MKLLITAFEPFGGSDRNSSLDLLRALPTEHGNTAIVKAELPVEYDRCGAVLREMTEREKPDAVLCLGQAAGRGAVTPEYVALNVDYSPSADNAGVVRNLTPIMKNAPAAYVTTLPVKEMVERMTSRGIPSKLSFSAGTYVCNNLMFHALHDAVGTGRRAGFLHLPLNYDDGRGTPWMTTEAMVEAVLVAVELLD